MTTTTYIRDTFQVLWNCPGCGASKLLGIDHRYCPNCGHPQDHKQRYIPEPGDRVPTAYLGYEPDLVCPHCDSACSSRLNNCHGCGAPLAGAKRVHVRRSIPAETGETAAMAKADHEARRAARRAEQAAAHQRPARSVDTHEQRPTVSEPISRVTLADLALDDDLAPSRRFQSEPWHWIVGLVALVMGIVIVALLWKRDAVLEVTGHHWERTIEVERFVAVDDNAWCSSMPSDAYSVSRRSQVHHTNRVPDGQTCSTVPESCSQSCSVRDNGNGSASTVCTKSCTPARQQCETRYRSVDVYADRCYYTVDRWRTARTARASGLSLTPEPAWPTPSYKQCAVAGLGCERLGDRAQVYEVALVERDKAKAHTCEFGQPKWSSFAVGQSLMGEVGVMTGMLDCDSLKGPHG